MPTCRTWISSDTVDRLERLKADTIYVRSHHLFVVLRNYTEFLEHRGNIKRTEDVAPYFLRSMTLPLSGKILGILYTLNYDDTSQMLHNMQRPTVLFE